MGRVYISCRGGVLGPSGQRRGAGEAILVIDRVLGGISGAIDSLVSGVEQQP